MKYQNINSKANSGFFFRTQYLTSDKSQYIGQNYWPVPLERSHSFAFKFNGSEKGVFTDFNYTAQLYSQIHSWKAQSNSAKLIRSSEDLTLELTENDGSHRCLLHSSYRVVQIEVLYLH